MVKILIAQVWRLPKALYPGVLHDGAGGEAKGVDQGVR